MRFFATHRVIMVALIIALTTGTVSAAIAMVVIGRQADESVLVPSNQRLTPIGLTALLDERPVDIALRPDGRQIAVTTTSLTFLIDTGDGSVSKGFDKASRSVAGLAYSPDGSHIYYSKGSTHGISVVAVDENGSATVESTIDTGAKTWPTGLSVSPDGKTLYVALFGTNSLGIIDLASAKLVKSVPVGSSPFGAYVSLDGKAVYTSNWGGPLPKKGDPTDPIFPVKINPATGASAAGSVSVYDVASGQTQAEIAVGLHPTAITFDKVSSRMYVANSNEDTISIIDLTTPTHTELERVLVRPSSNLPFGSMPNALALNNQQTELYVANGGNNALAVVHLSKLGRSTAVSAASDDTAYPSPVGTATGANKSYIRGFIPTDWYPVGVAVSPDGYHIYVANNKGQGSLGSSAGYAARSVFNLTGSVATLSIPSDEQLAEFTKQVDENSDYVRSLGDAVKPPRPNTAPVPVPERVGEPSVFKHVIYIIKENRTYDQVFGDIGKGNSDPVLAQFAANVTPNHHALANRFGLLDNFYASAVNSADGHQWTDEAIANVFAERVYGFYPSNSPLGLSSYGNSSLDLPPVSLWSNALAHNVSLRNYGEDGANTVQVRQADGTYTVTTKLDWLDIYRDWQAKGGKYRITANAITPPLFVSQDHNYPAYETAITDQIRADEWQREFNQFVQNGKLPQLSVVWLPDDHTSGTRTGSPTPAAQVADNDLALGRMIDTLSHSIYWKDTAVFVVEDDAQDGVDHVDGHRTVSLVVSAYNKPGSIDSTLYNQTSMVRTIEQILGLPPMNQFDLTAPLMTNVFQQTPDLTPYTVLPNQVPLDQLNGQPQALSGQARIDALQSNTLDFSKADAIDPRVLNPIVWRATMGNQPYPTFAWQQNQPADTTTTDSDK